ncbi:hypothetical protein HMI54_015147 [Coelomomyces lativittatus]|nr:hypothetical protein HMI54_015147 [Coelomomyces lativittatus]
MAFTRTDWSYYDKWKKSKNAPEITDVLDNGRIENKVLAFNYKKYNVELIEKNTFHFFIAPKSQYVESIACLLLGEITSGKTTTKFIFFYCEGRDCDKTLRSNCPDMEDCPHESGIFQVPINYKLICGLNKTIKLESYSFQVTYKNDPSKYDELDQYLETYSTPFSV